DEIACTIRRGRSPSTVDDLEVGAGERYFRRISGADGQIGFECHDLTRSQCRELRGLRAELERLSGELGRLRVDRRLHLLERLLQGGDRLLHREDLRMTVVDRSFDSGEVRVDLTRF